MQQKSCLICKYIPEFAEIVTDISVQGSSIIFNTFARVQKGGKITCTLFENVGLSSIM